MPDGLQNPNLSLTELYKEAEQAMPLLQQQGKNIIADLQKKHPGIFDSAYFEMGPLKEMPRAKEKISGEYSGDQSKIVDLARGRIVVETPEQIEALREYFREKKDGFKIEVSKDRFAKPSDTNFRDLNMQVRMSNGHVVEFRIEQKDMLTAAKKTHDPYERIQEIERAAQKEGRLLTEAEAHRRQVILDEIRDIHGEPAKKAGLDRLLNEEGRARMVTHGAERVLPRAASGIKKIGQNSGVVAGVLLGVGAAGVALASGCSAAEAGETLYSTAVPYGESQIDLAKGDVEAAKRSAMVETASNIGGWGGAAAGAAAGAAVGSVVPIVGTAAGAIIGGIIGSIGIGYVSGEVAGKVYDSASEPRRTAGLSHKFHDRAGNDAHKVTEHHLEEQPAPSSALHKSFAKASAGKSSTSQPIVVRPSANDPFYALSA